MIKDLDKLKIYIPAFLLIIVGFLIAYQFVDPAPPHEITFSSGQKNGMYAMYAMQYRDYLQQHGVQVHVLNSAGSVQNIDRLISGIADIAFVQSSVAHKADQLQSLGSMYYEPLWVFLRSGVQARYLSDLQGKRLAIGLPGSGTSALALQLLSENGIDEQNTHLLRLSSDQATLEMMNNHLDAVLMVASASSQAVQKLQTSKLSHIMPILRAAAYTRRSNSISALMLPQGTLDLAHNIPTIDTPLLANTATLMVRTTLHPALQSLLMQAAAEIHAGNSMFSDANAFPNAASAGIPLSRVAARFYKSGPSILQRFLPFWAATMVDRLKVMLLPFLALLLPLSKVMPPLYRWRIRSRIYRWYAELNRIDLALLEGFDQTLQDDLERIESEIRKVRVPLPYAEELYELRLHVALMHELAEKTKKHSTI